MADQHACLARDARRRRPCEEQVPGSRAIVETYAVWKEDLPIVEVFH